MDIYASEDQQVEAIKQWWKKNGRSLIIAVIISAVAVVGWRGWQDEQRAQSEAASIEYQRMLAEVEQNNLEGVYSRGKRLTGSYPNSPYAAFASLQMARIALLQEDMEGAAAYLRWVMESSTVPGLDKVARLRLARVLNSQGRSAAALVLLDGVDAGTFLADFEETKGDIHLTLGNKVEARNAYNNALAGYSEIQEKQTLLKMKLDDLAGVE
ncbi:MAG: tetratricopeptide repeat protein [Gammaproteobacteria bacterium]|nr:tetratricopeptide repeat protein [Gammaproteobacteria bacterium]